MQTPKASSTEFDEFTKKSKFIEDGFYPGIEQEHLRPLLTENINLIAKDFEAIVNSANPTDEAYLEQIGIGLARFNDIELDTEDRERVCEYIEQIMDIVGLESSNGQLNNWLYGFDPTDSNN